MTALDALIRKWEEKLSHASKQICACRNVGAEESAEYWQTVVYTHEDILADLRSLKKPKRTKKGER